MLKAMLFDLDGTLGDTLPLCLAAFRKAIEPLSGTKVTPEEIIATFGPSEEGTIKAILPDHYDEGIREYWRCYEELHDMCPAPFDLIPELLAFLRGRGLRLGMVTGKAKPSADISMERFCLTSLFDDFEYGCIHGPRKPEAIRMMLARHGVRPDEAAYVGDTPSDIIAAQEAGVLIYSAAWAETASAALKEQLRAMKPDGLFESVRDFRTFLHETL